jgi:hypothetical protein
MLILQTIYRRIMNIKIMKKEVSKEIWKELVIPL